MCGFAGVIAWDEKYRVSRDTLAKMSAAVAHRGPDGEGTYFSPDAEITPDQPQVALAHRRLAIIDPDPRGNQPFTDGEGRWLVYNGEIYNYRELRVELKSLKPGYQWRTDCDTEVLLVAYGVWGEKCVEHFNGMFAFAIWDGLKRELFLARDRMGQKPLYLSLDSDRVAFASELPAVRAVPWVSYGVGLPVVKEYLRWGYVPQDLTPYTGVRQLEPRRTLTWRTGGGSGYDHPLTNNPSPLCDSDAVRTTRERVRLAVKQQLVSDVPLGCFLSGGVDSSVIAAAMRATVSGGQPVHTFSIAFDDRRYDESPFAEAVARHLGTRHKTFRVRPDAAADLPKLAAAFAEPFADSSALPTHYLSRETRGHVKVALSGDGGDELFGGYDRYRAMRLASRGFFGRASPIRTLLPAIAARLPGTHPKSRTARLKRFAMTLKLAAAQRYASLVALFDHATLLDLFGHDPNPGDEAGSFITIKFDCRSDQDDVQRSLAVDRATYLPEDLLRKLDRASMLHALEVRSPFMDHELVGFAAGLTTDQLLKGGPKRMLREAFADDLPAWVFKRKKMGFAVPIGDWFRAELRPMLHDHLFAADSFGAAHFNLSVVRRLVDEHERFKVDHSQRLYALLMLELWWKTQRGDTLPLTRYAAARRAAPGLSVVDDTRPDARAALRAAA
jgi:asparagine synthase (glutamine-hydrolysing)